MDMYNHNFDEKKYNFLDDTLFSNGNNLEICNEEIKKINKLSNHLFNITNSENVSEKKRIVKEIFSLSEIVFNELYLLNKDKFYKIFIDEIKDKYFLILNDLKIFFLKKNFKNDLKYKMFLESDGYYFDMLSKKTLNNILKIADKFIPKFEKNIKNNKTSREDLSINTGKDVRKIIKLVNKEFYLKGINQDVSNYMKADYEIIGCALEMSTEHSVWWKWDKSVNCSKHTTYAHIDQSLICPKAICYLTDVNNDTGPTIFYPKLYDDLKLNFMQSLFGRLLNSIGKDKKSKLYDLYNHTSNRAYDCEKLFSHLNTLPKNLRFESHIGWYIKANTVLEKKFLDNQIIMKGESGKFVVFDGSKIFHRGGNVIKGQRLALQLTFGKKSTFIKKIYNKFFN